MYYVGFDLIVINRQIFIRILCPHMRAEHLVVFYPSIKVKVKVVSVNMKSGTMNVLFVAISLLIYNVNIIFF